MTESYNTADKIHFGKQLQKVYDVMKDGLYHTPYDIEKITGINCSSITSRLRALRQTKFGGYIIERRRKDIHTHEYRLSVPEMTQLDLFDGFYKYPIEIKGVQL